MPRYLEEDEQQLAESFFVFTDEQSNPKKTTQVMVGEGCPYSCGFCSEGIKKVWFGTDAPAAKQPLRHQAHVTLELDEIVSRGYDAVFFDDSTFFSKPNGYLQELFATLQNYNLEWGCQTTISTLEAKLPFVQDAAESGCSYIYIGLEHSNGRIIDSFNGGGKLHGNYTKIFDELQKQGIRVGVSLTFGHPDPGDPEERTLETKETATEAIDALKELLDQYQNICNVAINLITYHPGTPISQRAEEKGIEIDYTGLPNTDQVFRKFEEGMGPHPLGVDEELASYIATYAQQAFGDKLLLGDT